MDSEKPNRQVDFVRDAHIIDATPFYLQFESHPESSPSRPEIEASLKAHFGDKFGRFLINSERQTLRGLQIPIILLDKLTQRSSTSTDGKRENAPRSLIDTLSSPAPESSSGAFEIATDFVEELLEWIGAMHCRVRSYVEGQPIDFGISTMSADALERAPMHGLTFRHEGFLIPSFVKQQVLQAKSIVDAGMAPYAIVSAWAFVDQPRQNVHHFRDQHFTIVILPEDLYLLSSPLL